MRIVCIAGSNDPGSWSTRSAQIVCELFEQRGAEVDFIRLQQLGLPQMDIDAYRASLPHPHAAAADFIARVGQADAVLLATPVHHASYSGLLKTALDHLQGDAFAGRAVGLVANAGATRGATIACEHLRAVVKAMEGWTIPTQLATSSADFDPQTRTYISAVLLRRAQEMVDEMWMFTTRMRLAAGDGVSLAR